MENDRTRRSKPGRIGPIREWENVLRQETRKESFSDHGDSNGSERAGRTNGRNGAHHANGKHTKNWDDAITDAVNTGYRIIEEQIAQGKRVAEQMSTQSYTPQSVGGDMTEFVQRVLRFYSDVGSSCFELIESVSRSSAIENTVRRFTNSGADPATHDASMPANAQQTASRPGVPIEIVSASPARVILDIHESSHGCMLGVHGLFALDRAKPPLEHAQFHYSPTDNQPVLKIRIPPQQPPDTYTGVVIDVNSNEPRGTLTIHISEAEAESS